MRPTGRRLFLVCGVLALLAVSCGSPFFPDTGPPQEERELRETPEGTVRQLQRAYENRRIDLFEELLYSEQDFRFYIPDDPTVLDSLQKISKDRRDQIDLNSDYIQEGNYVYLTYSEEIEIHEHLFQQARQIEFSEPLSVINVEYLRSLGSSDLVSDSTDAELAMVRTEAASIRIAADLIKTTYGQEAHEFPVGKQVFYLKKDEERLWRILLWFELDV
ncbi:MAG: hypothetical protein GF418_04405 [Chitinivibrionales bacterium]|nr:hypothetical protein [Chitinivibrionales bacterium]MBD3394849.1 hypothetical protein [Chitinivibrionales bacterium]